VNDARTLANINLSQVMSELLGGESIGNQLELLCCDRADTAEWSLNHHSIFGTQSRPRRTVNLQIVCHLFSDSSLYCRSIQIAHIAVMPVPISVLLSGRSKRSVPSQDCICWRPTPIKISVHQSPILSEVSIYFSCINNGIAVSSHIQTQSIQLPCQTASYS